MAEITAPRCSGAPTCRIPKDVSGTYACPHCRRIWIRRDDGHGPYWQHTPPPKH